MEKQPRLENIIFNIRKTFRLSRKKTELRFLSRVIRFLNSSV